MSRPGPPSRTTAVRPVPGDAVPAGHRRFLIRGQLRRPLALPSVSRVLSPGDGVGRS
ncbi:hypothetical protein [Streptomyces nigrescens]|uniref:hypothetical protein n=1 Tax=Streptomyces nigrescens TaxID=1920 RepID=UPI003492AD9E